jgi:hypothetical protein
VSRREGKTRSASVADARAYLGKAHEFLTAAQHSLAHENYVATTGNAVHAGIAAADAITAARAGQVWKGEHTQSVGHLRSAGGADGRAGASHLERLIPMKNKAEYDPQPVSSTDARAAVKAAIRLVGIADRAVSSAEPHG